MIDVEVLELESHTALSRDGSSGISVDLDILNMESSSSIDLHTRVKTMFEMLD